MLFLKAHSFHIAKNRKEIYPHGTKEELAALREEIDSFFSEHGDTFVMLDRFCFAELE